MNKVIFGLTILGLLASSSYANHTKNVKVCNILRNYSPSTLKIACDGSWDKSTTLKALYNKGWRYVGTALGPSGGQVVILEK